MKISNDKQSSLVTKGLFLDLKRKRKRRPIKPTCQHLESRIIWSTLSIAWVSSSCINDDILSTVCSMSACSWSACLSKSALNMLFRSMRFMLPNSAGLVTAWSSFLNRSRWHCVAFEGAFEPQKMMMHTLTSSAAPLLCCCPLRTYCISPASSRNRLGNTRHTRTKKPRPRTLEGRDISIILI